MTPNFFGSFFDFLAISGLTISIFCSNLFSFKVLRFKGATLNYPRASRPASLSLLWARRLPLPIFSAATAKNCLTNFRRSCIVSPNSKSSKYNDREKVPPRRFRELPAAARQCKPAGRHWPSSICAESPPGFRRKRVSSPLPKRRDSSGMPG